MFDGARRFRASDQLRGGAGFQKTRCATGQRLYVEPAFDDEQFEPTLLTAKRNALSRVKTFRESGGPCSTPNRSTI